MHLGSHIGARRFLAAVDEDSEGSILVETSEPAVYWVPRALHQAQADWTRRATTCGSLRDLETRWLSRDTGNANMEGSIVLELHWDITFASLVDGRQMDNPTSTSQPRPAGIKSWPSGVPFFEAPGARQSRVVAAELAHTRCVALLALRASAGARDALPASGARRDGRGAQYQPPAVWWARHRFIHISAPFAARAVGATIRPAA